jgi:hypothetical protein
VAGFLNGRAAGPGEGEQWSGYGLAGPKINFGPYSFKINFEPLNSFGVKVTYSAVGGEGRHLGLRHGQSSSGTPLGGGSLKGRRTVAWPAGSAKLKTHGYGQRMKPRVVRSRS